MLQIKLNNEKNGIELYFEGKPSEEVRESLKFNGFKWSRYNKCWYAKQSEDKIKFSESLAETKIEITKTKSKKENKAISLYDRLNEKHVTGEGQATNNRFTGINYNSNMDVKEIAKEVRSHLRKKFKECKFSVTISRYSMGQSIYVYLVESPYNYSKPSNDLDYHDRKEFEKTNNIEVKMLVEYAEKLLQSFNYDDSDSQSDYYNVNFYSHCKIDYDYKQTEQTEEHKQDIEDFRNKLLEDEKREEEEREKQYQERLKQEEESKIKREENKKKFDNMKFEVFEVDYAITNVFYPSMNKNPNYEEYIEQERGELIDTVITKSIIFDDVESLNTFKANLLTDFEPLKGLGGHDTNDKRINCYDDFSRMTEEERKSVKWYNIGIAIYLNDELQFVVNPEGSNYSKYVGLINKNSKIVETIEVSNKEKLTKEEQAQTTKLIDSVCTVVNDLKLNFNDMYKEENYKPFKQALLQELKQNNVTLTNELIMLLHEKYAGYKDILHKIITVCDSINEQFEQAKFNHEEDITIFNNGMGISETHVKYISHEEKAYAQYNKAVNMVFKIPRKKSLYQRAFYKETLICRGKIELPKDFGFIIEDHNGWVSQKSKYGSFDRQYWIDLLDYLKENNVEILVNTIKPMI